MKTSPRPVFLLHQTLQLALCIWTGSILLASAKPRFIRRTARGKSEIHHSRELVSTESNGNWLYTTPAKRLALRMVILGLCAAARSWKPISWSSQQTVLVLSLSVSLCGLSLCDWDVVAPRCFHFTETWPAKPHFLTPACTNLSEETPFNWRQADLGLPQILFLFNRYFTR